MTANARFSCLDCGFWWRSVVLLGDTAIYTNNEDRQTCPKCDCPNIKLEVMFSRPAAPVRFQEDDVFPLQNQAV